MFYSVDEIMKRTKEREKLYQKEYHKLERYKNYQEEYRKWMPIEQKEKYKKGFATPTYGQTRVAYTNARTNTPVSVS